MEEINKAILTFLVYFALAITVVYWLVFKIIPFILKFIWRKTQHILKPILKPFATPLLIVVLMISFGIVGYFMIWESFVREYVMPQYAIHLARNHKNIQNNGCLLYKGHAKRGGMYIILNHRTTVLYRSNAVKKHFPFYQKIERKKFDIKEFKNNHKDKCLKVKYIHVDLGIFGSSDWLYDTQE
ncbi:hypothetical protein [Wielerella bovis]|uniref:hypothetical protein n=1 Tax=Wielerella bovis TaxID=2917790 RepID=UPI002018C14C|nr:hypothetical protein [Wielerella bovis]ULJ64349.1 hypothetical protein MIS33_09390 [Wielerella bovis]ULJ66568.1 hypothetical protein MIS31_09995 [Wielerella bovis]